MSESIENAAQRGWQSEKAAVNTTDVRAMIERRLGEHRRRWWRFWASFAVIVPGWIAAFWLLPELRPVAAVGVIVAAWLAWQVSRRDPARRVDATELPCVAFARQQLSRERDFYLSIPKWHFSAVLVGQVAIVATLLTNPRFEKNALFAASLTVFIGTVIGVLVFAFRRSRRIVRDIDREMAVLGKEAEA